MTLDLREFFQATNPDKTLFVDNTAKDQNYYIDFSPVRGGHVIKELSNQIAFWSPDTPTCQLFTGHVGCGKSTELLQLKAQLEREGFHIVYFESSQNLEMADVDVSDILLAIAAQVSESLDRVEQNRSHNPQVILKQVAKLLQTEIELTADTSVPGLGNVAASTAGDFSVNVGIPGIGEVKVSKEEGLSFVAPLIGKITARAKASPEFRNKLRGYLEPRTNGILEAINSELIEPGIKRLKDDGKKGLVVIVDNLDRIDSSAKPWGRNQQEYLFVDRGEQLRSLNCHLIYTMPLALRFSNEFAPLTQRFKNPTVLPMVWVQLRDGSECEQGMALLRQMVLARAFPDLEAEQRLHQMTEIFDTPETLDRLCRISGGHVRNLLRLLNNAIQKEMGLPISRNSLEEVILDYKNALKLAVDKSEWALLRRVADEKKVTGDEGYEQLIRSMFVYEYRDRQGSWFVINPILAEAEEFKS
ncbi:P-loop NTPase fold protein [Coleofasciculus sp.]|uniref:P-loop NTPase fold protein n=1 Tax=Coleofasciculus sp. TaxID=3100458 RepID=UPI0039F8E0E3